MIMKSCLLLMGIAFCAFIGWRSNVVFLFRRSIIDQIYKKEDWIRRQEYFDSVSYPEMVWKFWKPIKSFYDMERLIGE